MTTVDAIDELGELLKAGGHKYKSKKKVGGKWVYDYGTGGKGSDKQLSLFGDSDEPEKKYKLATQDHLIPKPASKATLDAIEGSAAKAKAHAKSHVKALSFIFKQGGTKGDKASQRSTDKAINAAGRGAKELTSRGREAEAQSISDAMRTAQADYKSGLSEQLRGKVANAVADGIREGKKDARAAAAADDTRTKAAAAKRHLGSPDAGEPLPDAHKVQAAITDPAKITAAVEGLKTGQRVKVSHSTVMGRGGKGYREYKVGRRSYSKRGGRTSITLIPMIGGMEVKMSALQRKHNRTILYATGNSKDYGIAFGDLAGSLHGIIPGAIKKSSNMSDPIDALESLFKGDPDDEAYMPDDEAYMAGYKDAQSGKPAKPQAATAAAPEEGGDEQQGGDELVEEDGSEEQGEAAGPDAPGGDQDAIDALGEHAEDGAGTDLDGDGDADMPGEDVDGDGDLDETEGQDPEAMEGDGPPMPEDDGDNHGVGDLDEDGHADSLVQEITNLEKLYYAAKGLHGGGHHKAEKALDLYHRAVRKLVRATMGAGPAEEGAQPPQMQGKPPGKGGDGDQAAADKPPAFGGSDSSGDSGDPGQEADSGDSGEDDEDDEKKKPFGKSLDYLDELALEHGEPAEIRPILDRLLKSMPSPYAHLMGFIAREVEEGKAATGGKVVDVGGMCSMIISKMVDRFTIDGKLQQAAQAYHLTAGSISPIVEQLLGIPNKDATDTVRDNDSHAAMGAHGAEPMAFSRTAEDLKLGDNALAKGARGLAAADRSPRQVHLVNDTVDPSRAFAKAQSARVRRLYSQGDPMPQITVSADCPYHGKTPDAFAKSNTIEGYLPCTCPR